MRSFSAISASSRKQLTCFPRSGQKLASCPTPSAFLKRVNASSAYSNEANFSWNKTTWPVLFTTSPCGVRKSANLGASASVNILLKLS
ncbi:hypothetical protein HMPREF1705_04698 [Acetomicrobium hydrogeniformans ATCC BAA-1850]|uniref:Uncharacterized protein n=1 Tax=Acetomicrobium hydrogeniformans ATCC BAA-1850 TaxID=592015 RepID=A0A0T5XCT0_9BACT|nr:hypothetical protein HMPREF1705_04698 [Acetomicrobium hydrogeniformans ATCC BAA-1850]